MQVFPHTVRRIAKDATMWHRRGALLVGVLLTACTEASGPSFVVALRTELASTTVMRGDTLLIRAILVNPSSRRLDVGSSCGPPVLFELRPSAGDPIYPVPLDATFTCERVDVHELEPGETDTVSTLWRADAPAGRYTVRSGFRSAKGLERLTTPATLTIR